MTIGYQLFPSNEDYKSEWIKTSDIPELCCPNPKCQAIKDDNFFNPDFTFNKKAADIYYIYSGGIYLVSKRFKLFVEENKIDRLQFIQLPRINDYFLLKINRIVKVDPELIDSIYICPICQKKHFTLLSKGGKDFLKKKVLRLLEEKNEIKEGMFFTDIKLGEHVNRANKIIIGTETMKTMKEYKLKGLIFIKIIPTDAE